VTATAGDADPVITYADPEPNGLANLVGRLLEANLEADPRRRRLLRPSVVGLDATDADVSVTVRLERARAEVANGGPGLGGHVTVEGHAQDLLELAAAPLRLGLPDVFRRHGRAVVRRIISRDVRVSGMFRHPIRMSRFLRLLSVAR
jgi:hypothetical protein